MKISLGIILVVIAGAVLTGAARSAETKAHALWSKAGVPFSCEVPAGWTSVSIDGGDLFLMTPGKYSDRGSLTATHYRYGVDNFGSVKTYLEYKRVAPEDFALEKGAAELLGIAYGPEDASGKLTPVSQVKIGSLPGWRFRTSTPVQLEHPPVNDQGEQQWPDDFRPTRQTEDEVVILVKDGFWVFDYWAWTENFDRYLPQFEHLLATLKFSGQSSPKQPANRQDKWRRGQEDAFKSYLEKAYQTKRQAILSSDLSPRERDNRLEALDRYRRACLDNMWKYIPKKDWSAQAKGPSLPHPERAVRRSGVRREDSRRVFDELLVEQQRLSPSKKAVP